MKNITLHQVPEEGTSALVVIAADPPGPGNAHHRYEVMGMDFTTNPSRLASDPVSDRAVVLFQQGSPQEVGVNGVTNEILVAMVIDRLRSFQAGPYACGSNGRAVQHLEYALDELKSRTRDRISRSVEGTYDV